MDTGSDYPLTLGEREGSAGDFSGSIDEVYAFSRALGEAAIQALYEAAQP